MHIYLLYVYSDALEKTSPVIHVAQRQPKERYFTDSCFQLSGLPGVSSASARGYSHLFSGGDMGLLMPFAIKESLILVVHLNATLVPVAS